MPDPHDFDLEEIFQRLESSPREKIRVGDLRWLRLRHPTHPAQFDKVIVRTLNYTPSAMRGRSRRGRRKPGIWTVRVVYPLDHPQLEENLEVEHLQLLPIPPLIQLGLPPEVNTGHRTRAPAPPPKGKGER